MFDSRTIEAEDLESAIREAGVDTMIHGGAMVESAVLSTPSGEILWTGTKPAVGRGPGVGS
ncbi:hypothetical protein [Methylobacterium radiotolerans]|uniref:hypothetical protein n=1 Tax=Methylobacterium radiotolerans TaxID=31998 RepID=UPI0038D10D70